MSNPGAQAESEKPPTPELLGIERFFSSGIFFILMGSIFLCFSYLTMGRTHSSFSFVLVVIGVAVLLYGTGTQGMGQFAWDEGSAKYKVAMAGGAGVLALVIAFGIVWKSEDIKTAFQIEKKYMKVIIEPAEDGITRSVFSKYVAEITIDGEAVPAVRRNGTIEAYVDYFDNTNKQVNLVVDVYQVKPEDRGPFEKPVAIASYPINISQTSWEINDGGLDFPLYKTRFKISVDVGQQPQGLRNPDNDQAVRGDEVNLPPPISPAN
jgi:hypothetical protein